MITKGSILPCGKYKVSTGVINKGGMAVIQKGIHIYWQIPVIIKVQELNFDKNTQEKLHKLFRDEGKALGKLAGHSNIVSIFDIGVCRTTKGLPTNYIVCEYMNGGDAKTLIGGNYKKIIQLAADVSNGLSFAHSYKIYHRDIKPSNILLCDNTGRVKIGDFGLSKIVDDGERSYTVVEGGGTKGYMAPEQHLKGYVPSAKADIYQLGATLYHLLCNCLYKYNSNEPPHLINKLVPLNISKLVLDMLNSNPNERPTISQVKLEFEAELLKRSDNGMGHLKGIIIHSEQINEIRKIIKDKVEKVVLDLTINSKDHTPVFPLENEEKEWYATVLLRPIQENKNGRKIPEDAYYPIYFSNYFEQELVGSSDWARDTHLVESRLHINNCCSGLPIKWYREKSKWKWEIENGYIEIAKDQETDRIKYIILKNVRKARFDKTNIQDNIIRKHYATDTSNDIWEKAVDWDIRDRNGNQRKMSQNINTEILVPIYDPAKKKGIYQAKDIFGMVNFEWDQNFSPERAEGIAKHIHLEVQKENKFGIGWFIGQVLPFITLQG